ncbi:GNAT family N-acetyltransferase [Psychrobacter sp. YGAH215]|uniref:GNAT family N-acetyltransferase n=1 Tax=Psychrobacter sp. YGAH215 TaxID=2596826 RepID=UPI001185E957|nr:GNAT family protein [Psychrobacter sp. YGAH215]TSB23293.1 GNAT family N-acetyltransferase [Psychrobacter sp. YGAH215]
MNIKGNVVTLRAIEVEDLELLSIWSNSPELWENLVGWHFPYSKLSTEQYIKNINNNNITYQNLAIETEELGLIGTINLVDIDWKNRNASNGIMLGDKDSRGKGYALDAVMTMMRYAFKELNLKRLDAEMIDYNNRSINFYTKKCGWVIEGKKENWFYRNGQYHDKIIVGITHKQYDEHIAKTNYWNN